MNEIDFKSLIIDESEIESENNTEPKTTKSTKRSPAVFEQVANNKLDFAIRKTHPKETKLMAILPSVNQYYIKDEKTGNIDELTQENFSKFFYGKKEGMLVDGVDWISQLPKAKADVCFFVDHFIKEYNDLIQEGIIYYDSDMSSSYDSLTKDILSTYKIIAKATKELLPMEDVTKIFLSSVTYNYYSDYNRYSTLDKCKTLFSCRYQILSLREIFKESEIIDFIKYYYDAPITIQLNDIGTLIKYIPTNIIKMDEFKKYTIDNSVFCAYPFISTLLSYYYEEKALYGDVTDLFPKDFNTVFGKTNRLFKTMIVYLENSNATNIRYPHDFNNVFVENYNSNLDDIIGKYSFTTAERIRDIVNDLLVLRNSIGIVGDRDVYQGKSKIIFMRNSDTPDVPLITIKVTENKIDYVKPAKGLSLTAEQQSALTEWAANNKLIF